MGHKILSSRTSYWHHKQNCEHYNE